MGLRISKDLELPVEAVTHSFGLLAMRGAGKTNAARVLAEEMFDAGLPFVAIDPVGSWYGLRAWRDGSAKGGLSIPILGGRHADLPIHRGAGVRIAQLVVGSNLSCVLDLSDMESEAAKKAFLLDFARELYAKNETARHVFLEEADDYIPQRPMRDELHLKRAWENIVRRGRSRGLGFTLITQRSACVNKDVLTQVETLFVLRTTGKQDREALEAWVTHNDTGLARAELRAVPELASGEAFCWSPTLLGKSVRLKFRLSRTFDSGATPKPGEAPRAATLADVDLDAVRGELEALDPGRDEVDSQRTESEVKELLELRREWHERGERIAELERELAEERANGLSRTAANELRLDVSRSVEAAFARAGVKPRTQAERTTAPVVDRDHKPAKSTGVVVSGETAGLSKCARALLTALYQHGDLSLVQAAIIAGYAPTSGGVSNAAGELRAAGYAEGANAQLSATEKGCVVVADAPKLPTGKKLAQYWMDQKLGRCERMILSEVLAAYPNKISLKEAAKRAGYSPESGGVSNAAGLLRTLRLVVGGNAGMQADRRLV